MGSHSQILIFFTPTILSHWTSKSKKRNYPAAQQHLPKIANYKNSTPECKEKSNITNILYYIITLCLETLSEPGKTNVYVQ